jgi:Ulp1 family protease
MAQKFPAQHGLQDTLTLDKFDRYQSSNEDFVQLINVAGNHWVCASNRLSPPGIVHVYDSLPSSSINSSSLHRQIAAIVKTEYTSFTVKHVDVQRQVGSSDCGLFAIVYATSLCSGLDPHTLKYDQSKMRSNFLSCVESGCLDTPKYKYLCRKCTEL